MNAERRKRIADIVTQLDSLQSDIESIRDEEQDYFDNMPESLQGGEKGQAAEEAVSYLEEAGSQVDDAKTNLESLA